MKRLPLLIILLCLSCFWFPRDMVAADNGNGVDIVQINNVNNYVTQAVWFTSYDVASTSYVYNEAGGQAAASGSMSCKDLIGVKMFYVSLLTFNATNITVRIEGRPSGGAEWFEIYTHVFTAATTIGVTWPITEYAGDIRVGALVDTDGGANLLTVSADMVTQKK